MCLATPHLRLRLPHRHPTPTPCTCPCVQLCAWRMFPVWLILVLLTPPRRPCCNASSSCNQVLCRCARGRAGLFAGCLGGVPRPDPTAVCAEPQHACIDVPPQAQTGMVQRTGKRRAAEHRVMDLTLPLLPLCCHDGGGHACRSHIGMGDWRRVVSVPQRSAGEASGCPRVDQRNGRVVAPGAALPATLTHLQVVGLARLFSSAADGLAAPGAGLVRQSVRSVERARPAAACAACVVSHN